MRDFASATLGEWLNKSVRPDHLVHIMLQRVRIYYSGMVQGVGFRFTARELANELGIGGWVKNLADGKVEIVAEAEKEKLEKFLGEIQRSFSRVIKDTDIEWQAATGEFKDFGVKL